MEEFLSSFCTFLSQDLNSVSITMNLFWIGRNGHRAFSSPVLYFVKQKEFEIRKIVQNFRFQFSCSLTQCHRPKHTSTFILKIFLFLSVCLFSVVIRLINQNKFQGKSQLLRMNQNGMMTLMIY